MTPKEPRSCYNDHVFEIRYKPNARVLDYRGDWAEKISKHMKLTEWRIEENRLDVFDKDKKNTCFVGFRNAGFATRDVHTANFFPDQAIKFFKFVLGLEGFGSPIFVRRIGVRSRFYTRFDRSFEELFKHYSTRFTCVTDKVKEILGGKVIDIGCPLNFSDKYGSVNTSSGPMAREQAQQFFSRDEDLPEVGLYFDIDYWKKPESEVDNSEILHLIRVYSEQAWDKHDRIRQLIMAD